MSKRPLVGAGVTVLLCSSVAAQTLSIDHQPVVCAAAEKFPRLEARFAPAESVATARVLFQGQSPDWYSVVMKPEGLAFVGVLPRPKKSLKTFRYYIEVTDKRLGTSRTADYTTNVVESTSACKGRIMAGALSSASVILQGPAGAAALPAGFASSGVVAAGSAAGSGSVAGAAGAGGGIGGTALVLGGLAAAGGVAAVAASKGGGDSASAPGGSPGPAPAPTPAPSPTPTPGSGSDFAGRWTGTMQFLRTHAGGGGNDCNISGDVTLDLTQTGSSVVGSLTWVTRSAAPASCDTAGNSVSGPVTGSANGATVTLTWSPNQQPVIFNLTGALAGRTITGALTGAATDGVDEKFTGTWIVSH